MNWVGGARRRIKGFSRNDRKIQKEYFERKRLSAEALKAENHDSKVKVKNRPTSSKQGSKVSQDLLAFQIARKASQNRGSKEQANFRVLDLGKKKTVPGNAIIAGKCIQTVDLAISPQEAPSVLNLSGSPVNKSSDTNTSGYNTQQWYKQRNHCGDAKRREVTPKKKHLFMDFLGEKLPVPMSHPPRERTQHQREHLFCPKPQQSAESGYQTDITNRYVCSQVPSLSHYDADSDVSSLVSSFPHKQRFTRKSGFLSADSPQVPAKWWTQNGTRQEVNAIHASGLSGQSDQNLLPDPETRTEYLHKAQSVQRRSRRDSVVQELFMHQEIHSPLMNFSRDKITNHQPYNSLEDAETSSGSFFTGALPHYHDHNVHQQFIHGKLPVPSFFSTHNNHTRQALREQSPPCSNSSPNAIISLQNHSVNDSISGMFYADRPIIHSRNKPHASDVLNHTTNNSNSMNKAVYRDSEPNICVTKQSGNSKMKDSDSKRRDSHEDLYQNYETRCDSPVVPAENNREMYKQAAAMTPSTPVNYRRSYDDCLINQCSRKPQPPDTASTSTFSVSRRHSASSASNVYLEICSLEDQVPLQKEKTSAAGNQIKINTANEKTPTRKNSLDSDILTLVSQMVDYIVMDQNLSSALKRAVKKNGGHLPALHLHSTLGLLSADRVQLCDSSSKSPLNSPVKSLLDPVLGEAAQVERKPTNNVQSACCETDRRPVLVEAACSPLRVVCPQFQSQIQRRYNTRRHGSSLNFCTRPSPRPPVNQRKHRKMSTNSREVKKKKQAIKENETEQMHLTQPED